MLTKIKNLFSKDDKTDQVSESLIHPVTESVTPDKEIVAAESNITGETNSDLNKEQITANISKYSVEEIKTEVTRVLKTCYDPEIPVDVFELGLIYEINVATNGDVLIVMTLTSPSCPVAGTLPNEIEQKVKDDPMVNDCKVQLTFDPPWSQKNMSEVAKLELGFL